MAEPAAGFAPITFRNLGDAIEISWFNIRQKAINDAIGDSDASRPDTPAVDHNLRAGHAAG